MSRSLRRLAATVVVVLAAGALPALALSNAGASPDRSMYRPIAHFKATGPKVRVAPTSYSAVRVDLDQVRAALRAVPRTGASVFQVPAPNGGTERFAIQRTTVMQSRLAAAHPEITTYAGRSLDHRGTTVALDVTPMGFHASVRGPVGQRAWYVDPAYNLRGTTEHLSYYGGSVPRTEDDFVERETRDIKNVIAQREAKMAPGGVVKQRIYRLALTSDPSYADYFGTANVLAEKVTLINRVNQIYNDDLAINLQLVDATDALNLDTEAKATGADGPCGAHPCFDPQTVDADSQLAYCDVPGLGRNRTVLGQLVGASNYDIGHLALGVNGGGVAYLGVVGWDYKGGGCTGLPKPEGDFFAIDYVAHEMGHQFAGNHTFNGVQYACSGGNRNGGTSVEPGSGSSVMAYAGICLQDDLQPHSDPYFSQRTIREVSAYTRNPTLPVAEVQTVSLSGFGTDGDQVTIGYGAETPITLTRGTDYDAAGIEAAVESLTGAQVTVAGWGYDPYGSYAAYPAPLTTPDDTGFEVIFSPYLLPENAPADSVNMDSLTVTSATVGVTGFVGETARGGVADNRGSQVITTANHAPRVHAPPNRTLPIQTPFTLKGSGKDADGDTLSYLWEQNDVGAEDRGSSAGGTLLVDNHKVTGPLFRVFGIFADVTDEGTLETPSPGENIATGSPNRTFPDVAQILAGNTNAKTGKCKAVPPLPDDLADYVPVAKKPLDCYSEFLPVPGYIGRPGSPYAAMHFRLTARDGYADGGGTGYDDVTLRINPNAGPFLVTSQTSKATLKGGSSYKVTWAVNHTEKLSWKVRILLSTDGGKTWTSTLANRTKNDGSKKVRFPPVFTKKARIKIEAVGNYFFDINDHGFRIN